MWDRDSISKESTWDESDIPGQHYPRPMMEEDDWSRYWNCSESFHIFDKFTPAFPLLASTFSSFNSTDPADVSRCDFSNLNVELIWDWKVENGKAQLVAERLWKPGPSAWCVLAPVRTGFQVICCSSRAWLILSFEIKKLVTVWCAKADFLQIARVTCAAVSNPLLMEPTRLTLLEIVKCTVRKSSSPSTKLLVKPDLAYSARQLRWKVPSPPVYF